MLVLSNLSCASVLSRNPVCCVFPPALRADVGLAALTPHPGVISSSPVTFLLQSARACVSTPFCLGSVLGPKISLYS